MLPLFVAGLSFDGVGFARIWRRANVVALLTEILRALKVTPTLPYI